MDFEQNKKGQNFVNLIFQFGLVPTISKCTRMTNKQYLQLTIAGSRNFEKRKGFVWATMVDQRGKY